MNTTDYHSLSSMTFSLFALASGASDSLHMSFIWIGCLLGAPYERPVLISNMPAENMFDTKNPITGKISKIIKFNTQADEVCAVFRPTFSEFL